MFLVTKAIWGNSPSESVFLGIKKCLPHLQGAWVFHGKQAEYNTTWARLHVDLLKGRHEHLQVESTAVQKEMSR